MIGVSGDEEEGKINYVPACEAGSPASCSRSRYIVDMSGKVVKSIHAGKSSGTGIRQQVVSVSDLASGSYIVELVAPDGVQSARIVVSH